MPWPLPVSLSRCPVLLGIAFWDNGCHLHEIRIAIKLYLTAVIPVGCIEQYFFLTPFRPLPSLRVSRFLLLMTRAVTSLFSQS